MSTPKPEQDYSNDLLNYTAVHHQHKTATALSPGSLGRSVGAGSLCRMFGPNYQLFAPKLAAIFANGIDSLRRSMLRTLCLNPFCGVGDNAAWIAELLLPVLRPCCVDELMQTTSARVVRVRHLDRLAAQDFLATPKLAIRPKLVESMLTAGLCYKAWSEICPRTISAFLRKPQNWPDRQGALSRIIF